MKMTVAKTALLLTAMSATVWAQSNAGEQKPEASVPFNMTTATTFTLPWRLAFLHHHAGVASTACRRVPIPGDYPPSFTPHRITDGAC
jgi:hypothetical protein